MDIDTGPMSIAPTRELRLAPHVGTSAFGLMLAATLAQQCWVEAAPNSAGTRAVLGVKRAGGRLELGGDGQASKRVGLELGAEMGCSCSDHVASLALHLLFRVVPFPWGGSPVH